jgi:amino acid transporter
VTVSASPTGATNYELRRRAVGVAGIVFFVVSAAAPLAATLGVAPITFGATGPGAPLAYVIAAVILLFFAIGYAALSRHVTSSAGFAAYIERGLGRTPGFAAAATAIIAYNAMLLGIYGAFGFFTQAVVDEYLGINWAWYVWTFIGIAAVGVLGYLEINLSAKILGTLMIAEVSLLVVFDVVVPARGGASGVNFEGFAPDNLFQGAAGLTILFAISCFVGFEATAIYGEEARDPHRTVPRATFIAVLLIGGFYTVTMWAIGLAHGADAVQEAATADPANFVFAVNTEFVGEWSTKILSVLVVTSYFATLVAFHNTIARYMFSLGRGGAFPSVLRKTHARSQSPHVASLVGTATSIVVVGCFALAGADPFLQMFALLTGLGTLGVLSLQAATTLAAVVYFRRERHGNPWSTLVAPILGCAGLLMVIVLGIRNWALLTGATTGLAVYLPWLLVLAAVAGVVLGWVKRDSVPSIAAGFEDRPPTEADALISGAVAPTPKATNSGPNGDAAESENE